jgi:hypothetical protein
LSWAKKTRDHINNLVKTASENLNSQKEDAPLTEKNENAEIINKTPIQPSTSKNAQLNNPITPIQPSTSKNPQPNKPKKADKIVRKKNTVISSKQDSPKLKEWAPSPEQRTKLQELIEKRGTEDNPPMHTIFCSPPSSPRRSARLVSLGTLGKRGRISSSISPVKKKIKNKEVQPSPLNSPTAN